MAERKKPQGQDIGRKGGSTTTPPKPQPTGYGRLSGSGISVDDYLRRKHAAVEQEYNPKGE